MILSSNVGGGAGRSCSRASLCHGLERWPRGQGLGLQSQLNISGIRWRLDWSVMGPELWDSACGAMAY